MPRHRDELKGVVLIERNFASWNLLSARSASLHAYLFVNTFHLGIDSWTLESNLLTLLCDLACCSRIADGLGLVPVQCDWAS